MDDEEPTSETGRCAIHPDVVAARICERCGSFMCAECDEDGTARACPPCRARVDLSDFPIDRDTFSVGGVLEHSWATFKRHGYVLTGGMLIYFVVSMGFNFMQTLMRQPGEDQNTTMFASLLLNLLSTVVTAWMGLGLMRMSQDALEGRSPDLTTLFGQGRKLWKWLAALLLTCVIFAIPIGLFVALTFGVGEALGPRSLGPILLLVIALAVVPMIYTSIGVSFAICEITYDDDVGPIDALRRSWRMVNGHRWSVMGVMFIVWLVAVASVFACCVGIIPGYAFFMLTLAVIHRGLRNGMELPDPLRPTQF